MFKQTFIYRYKSILEEIPVYTSQHRRTRATSVGDMDSVEASSAKSEDEVSSEILIRVASAPADLIEPMPAPALKRLSYRLATLKKAPINDHLQLSNPSSAKDGTQHGAPDDGRHGAPDDGPHASRVHGASDDGRHASRVHGVPDDGRHASRVQPLRKDHTVCQLPRQASHGHHAPDWDALDGQLHHIL